MMVRCLQCMQVTKDPATMLCSDAKCPSNKGRAILRTPPTLTAPGDNAVQKAGARAGAPKAGTNRRLCLDAITAAGTNGLTYEELGARLGMEYSHVGPRVRELVRDGFVVDTGQTRMSSHQSPQTVWRAT